MALGVAEPEEGSSQDEGDAGWYPDDDGPGQAGGCCGGDRVAWGLLICKRGHKFTQCLEVILASCLFPYLVRLLGRRS